MEIFEQPYGIMPACDMPFADLEDFVRATAKHPAVTSYKVGFMLGLEKGLPRVVESIRKYTEKPIVYDHQKAGTDIPATGKGFARVLKDAGISVGILFPQAGPHTLKAWVEALQEQSVGVMVGGWMSHDGYLRSDGGFLSDEGVREIYLQAGRLGVKDFVMPGNQPQVIRSLREMLLEQGVSPRLFMPGFVTQGGDVGDAAEVSGDFWHAIVGRALVQAEEPVVVLDQLWKKIQDAVASR